MTDDSTLLRRYAIDRSEAAFAEFLQRHLPLVFGAARRRLDGDVHAASEVAQTVFVRVAQHAAELARHPVVIGWLYTATRHAVADRLRAERRRAAREIVAAEEILMANETASSDDNLRPVIDAALDDLPERDRELVLARFFEARSFPEIGAALAISEEAARKRVDRALERMRGTLMRRQITSTTAALAAALGAEAAVKVPPALAGSILSAAAAAAPAALTGAGLMAITKLQTTLVAALVLGGATATVVWQQRTITRLRATTADLESRLTAAERTRAPGQAKASGETSLRRREPVPAMASPTTTATGPAVTNPSSAEVPPAATAARDPQQIAKLHERYDAFLTQRGLTPAQRDQWIALMAEKDNIRTDLQQAVRTYGVDTRTDEFSELYRQATAAQWRAMREILGDDGYAAFARYEQDSAYRGALTPLTPRLAAAGAPLSGEQSDQLVQLVIANRHRLPQQPNEVGTPVQIDWSAVARDAAAFLTPAQQAVLAAYAQQHP